MVANGQEDLSNLRTYPTRGLILSGEFRSGTRQSSPACSYTDFWRNPLRFWAGWFLENEEEKKRQSNLITIDMGGTAATGRPRTVELFKGYLIRLETSLERQKVDLVTDGEYDRGVRCLRPLRCRRNQGQRDP